VPCEDCEVLPRNTVSGVTTAVGVELTAGVQFDGGAAYGIDDFNFQFRGGQPFLAGGDEPELAKGIGCDEVFLSADVVGDVADDMLLGFDIANTGDRLQVEVIVHGNVLADPDGLALDFKQHSVAAAGVFHLLWSSFLIGRC